MKKVFSIIYLIFLITNVTNSQNLKDIKLVFTKNSFHNIKIEDAKATTQILANHIKKIKNIKNEFIVELVSKENEILDRRNDFDLLVLTTEQYLKLKNKMPLEPFCVNYANGHYGFIYHLIVNRKDNINNIDQLKGESIYTQAHTKEQAATMWVDKLLKHANIKSKKEFFKDIIIDNKATNVLMPVFFNKAKACVITDASLNLLMELNPAIKNQIKILYTSEPIIVGLTCLNSDRKNEIGYEVLKDVLPTLQENQYGKQFLDLFRAEKLILFKEEYLRGYYNLTK